MRTRLFTPYTRSVRSTQPFLSCITSGAQTGVDRGAHDAALSLDVPIRGWVPKNLLARDPIPLRYFPMLKEMTDDLFPELKNVNDNLGIYRARTEQNAKDSDGTLVLVQKESEFCGGTLYTAQMAEKHKRPCFIFNLSKHQTKEELIEWIISNRISNLNVGGPNEEKSPGIYLATFNFITGFLMTLKPTQTNNIACYNK